MVGGGCKRWAAPALCSPFLLGALWDAENKIVLGHILRPFGTPIVHPQHYLSSAQALGLNIKWAGVINSLTPQYDFDFIYYVFNSHLPITSIVISIVYAM